MTKSQRNAIVDGIGDAFVKTSKKLVTVNADNMLTGTDGFAKMYKDTVGRPVTTAGVALQNMATSMSNANKVLADGIRSSVDDTISRPMASVMGTTQNLLASSGASQGAWFDNAITKPLTLFGTGVRDILTGSFGGSAETTLTTTEGAGGATSVSTSTGDSGASAASSSGETGLSVGLGGGGATSSSTSVSTSTSGGGAAAASSGGNGISNGLGMNDIGGGAGGGAAAASVSGGGSGIGGLGGGGGLGSVSSAAAASRSGSGAGNGLGMGSMNGGNIMGNSGLGRPAATSMGSAPGGAISMGSIAAPQASTLINNGMGGGPLNAYGQFMQGLPVGYNLNPLLYRGQSFYRGGPGSMASAASAGRKKRHIKTNPTSPKAKSIGGPAAARAKSGAVQRPVAAKGSPYKSSSSATMTSSSTAGAAKTAPRNNRKIRIVGRRKRGALIASSSGYGLSATSRAWRSKRQAVAASSGSRKRQAAAAAAASGGPRHNSYKGGAAAAHKKRKKESKQVGHYRLITGASGRGKPHRGPGQIGHGGGSTAVAASAGRKKRHTEAASGGVGGGGGAAAVSVTRVLSGAPVTGTNLQPNIGSPGVLTSSTSSEVTGLSGADLAVSQVPVVTNPVITSATAPIGTAASLQASQWPSYFSQQRVQSANIIGGRRKRSAEAAVTTASSDSRPAPVRVIQTISLSPKVSSTYSIMQTPTILKPNSISTNPILSSNFMTPTMAMPLYLYK